MNKSILITGANGGLGLETARQLALLETTEKIYLGVRSLEKGKQAQKELEKLTNRKIFIPFLLTISSPKAVKKEIELLPGTIDALIMQAGGMGGRTPNAINKDGVTEIFASNVLGHLQLLETLLESNKLNNVALFAGSEAIRGIKAMGMKQPNLKTSSVEEFTSLANGSLFKKNEDPMVTYGPVKYMGTMALSALARKYPKVRIITMSPGGTQGTKAANDMPLLKKWFFKYVAMGIIMPLFGMAHSLKVGAKRFVDGINDTQYKTGVFYASIKNKPTGPIANQNMHLADLDNTNYQDNALTTVRSFYNN